MVYIEEGSEMGQALNDSIDTVYTFRNADYHDYWDLAPEGIGLEAWSEDGYLGFSSRRNRLKSLE